MPAIITLLTILLSTLEPSAASAQSVKDFYSGRQVKFAIGSAGGGGYDFYSRLVGRFMSRHLPGSPLFVMQNIPEQAG
jgi:hypothetical protein